ncbi:MULTISPECIES: nitroreductase family deazaflavin-dependent oxidoreductase [unclassified Salinibacterium]|uniref:nitroreductase family deazaflavin-dependent oxidoreductase n=1 Tax=unclassified Salinibacterium TaxID=2632331 RepID=UPI00142327C3|nr:MULTISPECIES: nitroreductase family deazaflavin-dependent oxidoreductase [unclassified Salinibacterium]
MPLSGEYGPGTSKWAREQAELIESSGGTRGLTLGGRPVVLLTTLGAISGKLRKTVLMRVEHDGQYAVVGSKGGGAKHPKWVFNVRANPLVELQDGRIRRDYTAHETEGEERDLWWQRAVEAFPTYASYQLKTKRLIPVFVLMPVEG